MSELIRGLPRVKLTPAEQTLWETTTTAFLWHCPAFSHVFYNLLDRSGSDYHAVFTESPLVPVAATDGAAVAFNPKTYFKYNLHNRVFIFCHEVMHCMLDHNRMARMWQQSGWVVYEDGVKLPYVHKIMSWANDYMINDTLVNAEHGKLPLDGLWDRNIGTFEEACMDIYRKLFNQMKRSGQLKLVGVQGLAQPGVGDPQGGAGKPQEEPDGQGGSPLPDPKDDPLQGPPGGAQKPFDVLLQPGAIDGKDPHQASGERNEAEWQTTIETAHQIARLRGDVPSGLKRLFGELREPHVPWQDHIETLFARRLGSDGYNWRRPDRRLIIRDCYAPGRSGHGAKHIVVGCDTSGSVGDEEINMFFAELAGIFDDLRPEHLTIMWCDAKVHNVDECDEPHDLNEIRRRGAGGGGGTKFEPVFDMIDELALTPDCLVYLTDGQGTFPDAAPAFPVIWGSILNQPKEFPFGDVVMVPKQAKK
jgi:predicted metal-dependent peptidase